MTGWLPQDVEQLFGAGAVAHEAYQLLTVDVPAERWIDALTTARSTLGCTFFDWLSAVDGPEDGFRICAHVVALPGPGIAPRRLLLRTAVSHAEAVLPTATEVFAGAAWHERETHEMFGVGFAGHPHLAPLLLPENFEGHPLRKDFVLAARVAKAWPGAKEPGESEHGGPKRRQMLPPGVPDPNAWGPLKGQLPDAPPPRRRTRKASAAPSGDAPSQETRPRRNRSASGGSASQRADGGGPAGSAEGAGEAARRPRRNRSASEGSASQRAARSAEPGRRSTDAPWHAPQPPVGGSAEAGGAGSAEGGEETEGAPPGGAADGATCESASGESASGESVSGESGSAEPHSGEAAGGEPGTGERDSGERGVGRADAAQDGADDTDADGPAAPGRPERRERGED